MFLSEHSVFQTDTTLPAKSSLCFAW